MIVAELEVVGRRESQRRYAQSDRGKASSKKYRQSEKGRAARAAYRQRNRERIREDWRRYTKTDKGTRCDASRERERSAQISRSWTAILAEIEKCDVRCANCHRVRTFASGHHLIRPAVSESAQLALDVGAHP